MRSCARSPGIEFDPAWRTDDVRRLAAEVATNRPDVLPILADALEEAGCGARPLLDHLRADLQHFPGCWVAPLLRRLQFDDATLTPWVEAAYKIAWYRADTGHGFDYVEPQNGCPGDLPLVNFQHLPRHFDQLPPLVRPFALDLRMINATTAGLSQLPSQPGIRVLGLKHAIPSTVRWQRLAELSDLRSLFLWGEAVNEDVVTALTSAPQLTGLALSRTQFNDGAAVRVQAMPWLRELNIREHFHLTDATARAIAAHPGLEVLNVADVRLTDAGFDHLMDFPRLRKLVAFGCKVGDDALRRLPRLEHLEELNVGGSNVTDAVADRIARLPNLRVLYLWRTGVTDAALDRLAGCTGLRELYIGGQQITDNGLRAVGRMTGLRVLDLFATDVTANGMEHLSGLTGLRVLRIGSTKVTDAGLEPLRSLTRLQSFDWNFSRVSDDAGRAFVESLPNCGP